MRNKNSLRNEINELKILVEKKHGPKELNIFEEVELDKKYFEMFEWREYDNAMRQGDIPKAITILKPLSNETRDKIIELHSDGEQIVTFAMLGNDDAKEVFKDWKGLIKEGNLPFTWDAYLQVYVTEKELIEREW